MKKVIIFCLLSFVFFSCSKYKVVSPELTAIFTENGNIEKIKVDNREYNLKNRVDLERFIVEKVQIQKLENGGIEFIKQMVNQDTLLTLIERYKPSQGGIRWEVEIIDDGNYWSTPIHIHFDYPSDSVSRFWTAWGSPYGNIKDIKIKEEEIANAMVSLDSEAGFNWTDPLLSIPFRNGTYYYGSPSYTYDNPRTAFCPFQGDLFCIPMFSIMEPNNDLGISVVQSPEDLLLDLYLQTEESGSIVFTHLNHRLGGTRSVRFNMDIVVHEADWRASLGAIYDMYPQFFEPNLAIADSISGTGAYSRNWMDFDIEKLSKMAFSVNWKASHDFPYMGMFLPPVQDSVQWHGFWRASTDRKISLPMLREYARQMKEKGFYVLSYFNVTEFGADIKYPAPPLKSDNPSELWKDANGYLYTHLSEAILYVPSAQDTFMSVHYGLTEPNKPFWTWGNAIVLDPGEPVYQQFLLEQAKRHVELIPDAYGICIDRLDWLRMYNHHRDDGVSWFGNQPVRSLYVSWMDLMEKLGPIFHDNNKVIYVNNHVKRLEQLKHVDGIFDEFTYAGSPLNTVGLLGIKKPVLGWIGHEGQFKPDPDDAMQKYLYMGVFPMAPFPANDHSLLPSEWIDNLYLDYGPLLKQLRGKKWILESHAVEVRNSNAKTNIFKTFEGFAIPVVFANEGQNVQIAVKRSVLGEKTVIATAILPGDEKEVQIKFWIENDHVIFDTPVKRGCAMIVIRNY
jgi:hypothetical protein